MNNELDGYLKLIRFLYTYLYSLFPSLQIQRIFLRTWPTAKL